MFRFFFCFFFAPWSFTTWASTKQNMSSGFLKKRDSNQSPQLQKLARNLKILLVACLDMILSNKQITKALISLRGWAGWSAPLLFANPRKQVFSQRGPYVHICVSGIILDLWPLAPSSLLW